MAQQSCDTPQRLAVGLGEELEEEEELASPFHLQLPQIRELDWQQVLHSPSRSLSTTPTIGSPRVGSDAQQVVATAAMAVDDSSLPQSARSATSSLAALSAPATAPVSPLLSGREITNNDIVRSDGGAKVSALMRQTAAPKGTADAPQSRRASDCKLPRPLPELPTGQTAVQAQTRNAAPAPAPAAMPAPVSAPAAASAARAGATSSAVEAPVAAEAAPATRKLSKSKSATPTQHGADFELIGEHTAPVASDRARALSPEHLPSVMPARGQPPALSGPTTEQIHKIARALGVPPHRLPADYLTKDSVLALGMEQAPGLAPTQPRRENGAQGAAKARVAAAVAAAKAAAMAAAGQQQGEIMRPPVGNKQRRARARR
eukprot:SAG11_NODE_2118_length_3791_cov_2.251625_2_plen_375_part_00